jgi:2-isopropylmalate synthase
MLTDDTLREGMQAPGISFSVEEKKQLAQRIANCGIEKILISYPPAHHSEWEIARYVSSENIFREVYGLGRSIVKDIDNIHSSGCHLSLHFPFKYESLDEVFDAVKYAVNLDPLTEVSVVDITQYSINELLSIVKKLSEMNVGTIQLPDTMGKARPKMIGNIVREAKKISDSRIEIHCHNDQGFSLANAVSGIEAGADSIDTTFLGIGERNGITDTLSIGRYLVENGIMERSSLDRIRDFSIEFLDIIIRKAGNSFFLDNIPNIGKNILTHTAGTHAAFSGVFGGENFSVNVYTGRSMVKRILAGFDINIKEDQLSKLIESLKNRSAEEGRVIQTEEVIEEAKRYVQSN